MPSRTHIHPAFHTSLENREMFGWVKPVKPTHTLISKDGHQRFDFKPDGDHVHFVRTTKNMTTQVWKITCQDILPIEQARAIYRDCFYNGARKPE